MSTLGESLASPNQSRTANSANLQSSLTSYRMPRRSNSRRTSISSQNRWMITMWTGCSQPPKYKRKSPRSSKSARTIKKRWTYSGMNLQSYWWGWQYSSTKSCRRRLARSQMPSIWSWTKRLYPSMTGYPLTGGASSKRTAGIWRSMQSSSPIPCRWGSYTQSMHPDHPRRSPKSEGIHHSRNSW